MQKVSKYLLGILTGALLALAFPPMPVWALSFVAFIPLLYAIEKSEGKGKFLLFYLTFFIYHAGTNWWISSWQEKTDPYLFASGIAVALAHPFLFMIPMYLYIHFRKRFGKRSALYLFPFIWAFFEWAHGLGQLSYPWLSIGYTQIYNSYWVQIADIFGVFGLGFFIVLFNVLFLDLIFRNERFDFAEMKSLSGIRKMIIMAIILLVPVIYGYFKKGEFAHEKMLSEYSSINVAVIQPNIDPWNKWEGSLFDQVRLHMRIQDSLRNARGNIDMAVWSETAIPFLNYTFNRDLSFTYVRDWIKKNNTALLTGFTHIYFYKDGEQIPPTAKKLETKDIEYFDSYNSAILYNADNAPQIYHKMRLTPFAERLPYANYIVFAKSWFEWGVGISSWQIGEKQHNLKYLDIKNGSTDSISIAPVICIESIYPDFVDDFMSLGAKLIVVITNDAWYNYTFGPEQHYQIAAMRAIENRRYLARCANSGMTGFIKPTGESLQRIMPYTQAGLSEDLPLIDKLSFYTVNGDIISQFSAILVLLGLLYTIALRKKK